MGGREDSEGLDPAGSEGADLPRIEGVPEGLKQKAVRHWESSVPMEETSQEDTNSNSDWR